MTLAPLSQSQVPERDEQMQNSREVKFHGRSQTLRLIGEWEAQTSRPKFLSDSETIESNPLPRRIT